MEQSKARNLMGVYSHLTPEERAEFALLLEGYQMAQETQAAPPKPTSAPRSRGERGAAKTAPGEMGAAAEAGI